MSKRARKPTKIGVRSGSGPPPGYLWNVSILDRAFEEARRILDDEQYVHVADQVRELAREGDPTHSDTIDVRQIEDFWEIRDKGGVLERINIRVFFFVHKPSRSIVVLGTINKKSDGPTPLGDRRRMARRMKKFVEAQTGGGPQ